MTLLDALATISTSDRAQVEAKLQILRNHTGNSSQAVINLYLENRLLSGAWQALFSELLSVSFDPVMIRRAITNSFRRYVLQGPALVPPHPAVFGRAVTPIEFCQQLVSLGHYNSLSTAQRNLRMLIGRPRGVLVRRWRNFDLGRYLMWSTFSAGRPFDGLPDSAKVIRGLLGLKRRRGDLLLLEYTFPPGVVPRFPTVAEAYAGDEWFYYFRPALEGDPHGKTMPWEEYQHETPRPEVVHEVIKGTQLAAPLWKVS